MKLYCWNILQALDRLANAILGGTDKEYLCSRVYRYKDFSRAAYWSHWVLDKLLGKGHCEEAYIDAQIGADFSGRDEIWY